MDNSAEKEQDLGLKCSAWKDFRLIFFEKNFFLSGMGAKLNLTFIFY